MNRTLKLVAAAIGALVIVAAAAVAIVVATIDPNDYKGRIADAARSATGRELVFDGDLSLSFFPWLGIAFGPMHLGNPPDFPKAASPDDDVFLRLKGGGLRVAFMPLLSKRVEVAELILDGLHLNLVRTAEGKTNWDFAKPGAAPAPSPQTPAPSAPSGKDAGGSGGGSPLAVAVDTLSVNGATLSFRDMATGQQFRARDLNVAVNGLAPGGDPADIRMNVAMSGQKPDIEADLSVTAKVQSDLGGSVLEVKGLTVTLTPKGGVLPAGLGKVELAGDMTLHTGPQRLDIASLALSTPTLRLGGKGAAALAAPSFEGVLTLAGSPRKALEALGNPVRTADPKALDALDLKLDVQAAPAKVDVRSITGKLDDTAIEGKASAVPGQVQVIRAELALDAIDVDRYLPPEGEKGKAADKPAAAPGTSKDGKAAPQGGTAEAKKALRNFDVDVTFKAGRLVASKVPMTNVLVRLVADKGLVRVNPLKLNLGGGSVDGDITADTRAEATKSRIVSTVKGVEVGELQQAALGKRHVSARTDVKTDLTATGDDWNAAKHTLAGTASLAMTQGTIHGFQIIPEGIKGAESKRAGASGQKFDSLTASVRADKGVVSNKDLKFVSPGIGATGAGTADLGRNVVDYAATLDVTGLPKIPIKISGPLDSPSYGVDPAKMLMNTLEGAGNVIQAPAEKGGEAVKGIGGAIKGLLPGQKQ